MAREGERTTRVMRAQLLAMGAARYEVGVREGGRMLTLTGTTDEVVRRVGWLKHRNAQGADVYVRPASSVGLVLVDDLTHDALGQMGADGARPAVVVETSPHNYQAWVRVADGLIAPTLATAVGRVLAERYGGDPNSADWRHYGRLAGLTNRKERHRRADGLYPYVLLRGATGQRAAAAAILLVAAQARLEGVMDRDAGEGTPAPFSHPEGAAVSLSPLGRLYQREVARLVPRYPALDPSRIDWMIVVDLARRFPDAPAVALERAMIEGSPHLAARKVGHMTDYVARTVARARAVSHLP